jgi:uroporphyrin-III C-methyltransferase/precorrin-2 dehydrogenase/sirohydrochlorin ferrochelatase
MKAMPHLPSHTANRRIEALSVLPVFFNLEGKRTVVIGGSAAAAWKAELLAAAGAQVEVHTPKPGKEMLTLVANGGAAGSVRLIPVVWSADRLVGAMVIVADTVTPVEAQEVHRAARMLGVPVNVIDRPEFCDFQFGSIVNHSPLVIAISTSGAAPVVAQEVRSRIESIIPPHLAHWVRIASRIRDEVGRHFPTAHQRRRFWSGFAARAMLRPPSKTECVRSCLDLEGVPARVTIIRAKTVEDLTLREARALQTADVIHIRDHCPAGILDFARREAERISHSGEVMIPLTRRSENIVIIQDRSDWHRRRLSTPAHIRSSPYQAPPTVR